MSQTSMTEVKKKPRNEVLDTVVVIIEALIIAFLFRTFLWQPFSIPTASMQSTMMIGDYFIANKWAWGLGKYSFGIPVPLGNRILTLGEPQRGDIAVFHNEPTGDDYIKRVMGLPGDHIQMKQGRLYINGEMLPREEVGRGTDTDSYMSTVPVILYKETLPNGVTHTIQEISDDQPLDDTGEYVVPAGHYFMMGDNRDRSADSRVLAQVGYVPATNLIGKAEARFFSIQDNIAPWQVWQWPGNVRWDRMFQSVYQSYTTTPSRKE
jgi:signal peptidase I